MKRQSIWIALSLFGSCATASAQNCVISGGVNFGTVTQNCIINPAPPPLYLLWKDFKVEEDKNKDFFHAILVRVTSTADMVLKACGTGVLEVNASPWPAGMMTGPQEAHEGACILKYFHNVAAGKWMLSVTTQAVDTKFTLEPTLQ
jgi:hypothetical protein